MCAQRVDQAYAQLPPLYSTLLHFNTALGVQSVAHPDVQRKKNWLLHTHPLHTVRNHLHTLPPTYTMISMSSVITHALLYLCSKICSQEFISTVFLAVASGVRQAMAATLPEERRLACKGFFFVFAVICPPSSQHQAHALLSRAPIDQNSILHTWVVRGALRRPRARK